MERGCGASVWTGARVPGRTRPRGRGGRSVREWAGRAMSGRTTTFNTGPSDMPIQMNDTTEGTGAMALAGKTVSVHYTGWLFDPSAPETKGRKFDSSRDRGDPFSFELGAGRVIAGWDRGVAGMRVGGHRRLTIPPEFGYGARGAGGVIPPGATLVFDVELLGVD